MEVGLDRNLGRTPLDALNGGFELRSFDVEEQLDVQAHLVIHLVDLHEGVEILPWMHQDLFE